MAQGPIVSIVITYYKLERYIRETVLSAINQNDVQVEVIVIDDGSPSPAAPYLSGISGIKLIRTENQGCATARNFGFQQSTGNYLIFLDGDDVLEPGAVKAHLEAFNRDQNAGLSFGAYRVIDEHGHELKPPNICRRRRGFHRVMFGTPIVSTPSSAMIRREAFSQTHGFDPTFCAPVEDYDFHLRLVQRHPFVRHTACVVGYRRHSTNASSDRKKMLSGALEVLDRFAASQTLTALERRRLSYGRASWIHYYNPEPTVRYRVRGFYNRLRTMLTLPPNAWFGR